MRGKKLSMGLRALTIFVVILLVTSTWAATNRIEKVLHSFGNGTDGQYPYAGLILDAAGNLYGTTETGGTYQCGTYQCGTVFELTPNGSGGWTETVLHNFNHDGTDGYWPYGGLILDGDGNLYGTTYSGGINCNDICGSVFKLSPGEGGWTEQVLHDFGNGTDGAGPAAGLIFDVAGNLYGTTVAGGTYGQGTVFELTPDGSGGWTETVLYSFCSQTYCPDGSVPYGGLIFDASGNLYGTTSGTWTVFELTPTASGGWTEQVLYSFGFSRGDGSQPNASLIFDAAGNLYGTTVYGGTYTSCYLGCGTVFELTPTAGGGWTEQVLHDFGNGTDGYWPYASLIFDAAGNLYGTTAAGGSGSNCPGFLGQLCGTVFELTPTAGGGWTEQVLHDFGNGTDAAGPAAGLIFDAAGNLYGTTFYGGTYCPPQGCGTVFELTPVYPCAKCSHAVLQ